MRLIDADALPIDIDYHDVEDAPTIVGWIPCSERLPEASGKYLVTIKWSDDSGEEHTNINTSWYKEPYDAGWEWSNIDVVAWMPLPEPYKEGE